MNWSLVPRKIGNSSSENISTFLWRTLPWFYYDEMLWRKERKNKCMWFRYPSPLLLRLRFFTMWSKTLLNLDSNPFTAPSHCWWHLGFFVISNTVGFYRTVHAHLKTDSVDYLKKTLWNFFYIYIFAFHSSSRHEKRCQMRIRLFSLFQDSKNQQC